MRYLLIGCVLLAACAQEELPVQDPLDYLRVGVDPSAEADTMVDELRRNGFEIGRRFDEPGYVALDAANGPEAIVRIVSSRGVVLSAQAPDVRWPERLWVELAPGPRPDFDRDGQGDVVVALRERDRTCLGWVEVDSEGFAVEVFRPRTEWGEAPCIVEIDPTWPRLLLEVTVPNASVPASRVRLPVKVQARRWVLDDSAAGKARWEVEIKQRQKALEVSEARGDSTAASRLRAELAWLDQLRNAPEPVLEPADDGEEAR